MFILLIYFQVLKRPVGTYQISFDLDLKAPKKSKVGKNKRNSAQKFQPYIDMCRYNCSRLMIVASFCSIVFTYTVRW